MLGRYRRPEPDAIEVIIGPRASMSGHLRCDASIRIDGTVEGGRLETPANVILTESAQVTCDIIAKTVSIRGTYRGTINAQRVELLAGSQVYGALNVGSFFMDEGVLLRAELNIRGANTEERPALPKPEQTGASIPVVDPPRTQESD
ncbi:MAG: polymer-forming cytoskeletal protein [Caldilineaceae bacterium]|nr:polymer-forming cytoskeletal protein [Caldilineaceae bacterium]